MPVLEDVRKYMDVALEKLSPAKAQDVARSLMQGQGRDQVTKFAQDLVEWSQKNRERVTDLVRREVRSQLKSIGVATKDDVDALKKRVRELERGGGPKSRSTRSTSKRTSAAKRPSSRTAADTTGSTGTSTGV